MTWWRPSTRAEPRAVAIADRHYSRQQPGTPQFVAPGRCMVLRHDDAALWVTSWQFAEFTHHEWPGAWVCSLFRNESPRLSSELITEAVAHTRAYFRTMPALGMVTFVDPAQVRPKAHPGYCFRQAGFVEVGVTGSGLLALQLLPEAMPAPVRAHPEQLVLGGV